MYAAGAPQGLLDTEGCGACKVLNEVGFTAAAAEAAFVDPQMVPGSSSMAPGDLHWAPDTRKALQLASELLTFTGKLARVFELAIGQLCSDRSREDAPGLVTAYIFVFEALLRCAGLLQLHNNPGPRPPAAAACVLPHRVNPCCLHTTCERSYCPVLSDILCRARSSGHTPYTLGRVGL